MFEKHTVPKLDLALITVLVPGLFCLMLGLISYRQYWVKMGMYFPSFVFFLIYLFSGLVKCISLVLKLQLR